MTVRKQLAGIAVFETTNAALFMLFAQHFWRENARAFAYLVGMLAFCSVLKAITAMIQIHTKNIDDDIARLLAVTDRKCDGCGRAKL